MDERFEVCGGTAEIGDVDAFIRTMRGIAAANGTRIVCLNADMVAGVAHVESAVRHAIRAQESGVMISSALEMEVLLYAAATRQCSVAIEFGVHSGKNRMYICFIPPSKNAISMMNAYVQFNEGWEEMDDEGGERLARLFSITPAELEVVGAERFTELVLERVALLDINK
ncbi:MAG: KEOPS complex subunit Cgi121 [Methanomicrobiales archaeon]|nr:KEOPS complex subunit Cgi121 [Methanomicrobiales archaeon]